MDSLRDLAGRLDDAGTALAGLARRLPYAEPGESAFGVDAPGRLGEVGALLHRHWSAALDSRARELLGAVEWLTETGAALRTADTGYADSDVAAYRRHPEEV